MMDEVQATHESVTITKHGRPVAKLVPVDSKEDDIYTFLAGKGVIKGTGETGGFQRGSSMLV